MKPATTPLVEASLERGNVMGVVGLQFGDEGKGKVIAAVQDHVNMVVRAQGGGNAGHTVFYGGTKIALNHLPSGLVGDNTKGVLGQGMVINIHRVSEEIGLLEAAGRKCQGKGDIILMGSAQFVLPSLQGKLDAALSGKIGTTARGIGPAYAMKAFRTMTTFTHMLYYPDEAKDSIRTFCAAWKSELGLDIDTIMREFDEHRLLLSKLVTEGTISFDAENSSVLDADQRGDTIMLEGAQALLLDLNAGTYPNVTSSDTGVSGLMSGSGLPRIDTVVGVTKPYLTRVGGGPMPSIIPDEEEELRLQKVLGEFGATTGGGRNVGYLDFVQLRHAMRRIDPDILAIPKLDVMPHFGTSTSQVISYLNGTGREGGDFFDRIPAVHTFIGRGGRQYFGIQPHYDEVDVPQDDITGLRDFSALPEACCAYVERILRLSDFSGNRVLVGTGPENEAYVEGMFDR